MEKKYISNHYNNLICVSITLTNIYLTYKREIIIHIKPMAMAVTHMAGSRGVGANAEGVPAWGRPHWRGSGAGGTGWHLVTDRSAGKHTLQTATQQQQDLLLPKGHLKPTAKGQRTNTHPAVTAHTGTCHPLCHPLTPSPSPGGAATLPAGKHTLFYITIAIMHVFISISGAITIL